MNRRIWMPLLLSVFICLPTSMSAQEKGPFRRNQIKFTPTKLIDFMNPGLEVGFERFHNKKNSTQLTVTYQSEVFNVSQYQNYQGWRYSLEQKFFGKPITNRTNYMAIELAYLNVDYDDIAKFESSQTYMDYNDSFHIAKQSISANFKLGTQFYFQSFVLEMNMGIGLKYKIVAHSGKENPSDQPYKYYFPNPYEIANKEGNYFGINLPVSIKVGYRF